MIAKIIKGADFGGVINYMLSKEKGKAKVLASNNIGFTNQNLCVHEFALQASMRPNVQKPVCHTILSFSANDANQLTDDVMIKIANEYLGKMGYGNTQSLIVRHSDRQHPHLHICINRIGNDGKTISDRNEKYRSTKICRELSERYGLTIGEGKKAVNRQQLRGEDKLRYEIFDAIKAVLPQSKNWKGFVAGLDKQGICHLFQDERQYGCCARYHLREGRLQFQWLKDRPLLFFLAPQCRDRTKYSAGAATSIERANGTFDR